MVLEVPHLGLKVHVEDAVGLVHHQELERAQGEALRVLHVVYQTPGGRWTRTTPHRSETRIIYIDMHDTRSRNGKVESKFKFRTFSRRLYPKLLTISTLVRRNRNNISLSVQ